MAIEQSKPKHFNMLQQKLNCFSYNAVQKQQH